jgi:hypothetical protein
VLQSVLSAPRTPTTAPAALRGLRGGGRCLQCGSVHGRCAQDGWHRGSPC